MRPPAPRSPALPAASAPAATNISQAESLSLEQAGAIARAWSMVHGFTMLVLEDRMSDILRRLPKGTTMDQLFEAMLKAPAPRPQAP